MGVPFLGAQDADWEHWGFKASSFTSNGESVPPRTARELRVETGVRVVVGGPGSSRRTARTLGSTGSCGDFTEVTSDRPPAPGLEPSILPLEGQSKFVAEQPGEVGCEYMGERDRVSL